MKVLVDDVLRVREFGRRGGFRPDQIRFYYQVVDYPRLILRCDGLDYYEWQGLAAVAKFALEGVDGQKIVEAFPDAPASWGRATDLVQVTLMPIRSDGINDQLPDILLSSAVFQKVKPL
jgi:hypothetical protein